MVGKSDGPIICAKFKNSKNFLLTSSAKLLQFTHRNESLTQGNESCTTNFPFCKASVLCAYCASNPSWGISFTVPVAPRARSVLPPSKRSMMRLTPMRVGMGSMSLPPIMGMTTLTPISIRTPLRGGTMSSRSMATR